MRSFLLFPAQGQAQTPPPKKIHLSEKFFFTPVHAKEEERRRFLLLRNERTPPSPPPLPHLLQINYAWLVSNSLVEQAEWLTRDGEGGNFIISV